MRFVVTGPARTWTDDILGYGQGPSFTEHDVYLIDAADRQGARWAALDLARRRGDAWVTDLAGEHPLSGVTVEDGRLEDPEEWGDLYMECA